MRPLEGFIIGAVVIFALASDAVPAVDFSLSTAEGRFERHLTVTGPVDLDLRTGSGGIDVRTGDSTTVHVIARIKARGSEAADKVRRIEANPPVEQQGNAIHIGRIAERELQNNVSIHYEVTVPRETRLTAHTGSGNQSIDGVRGPVEAQSGSGNLVIANTETGLIARTGSGDIRANAVGGPFTGHTGSGNIRAALTGAGDVEARTGSGDVDLRGVHGAPRGASRQREPHRRGRSHRSLGPERRVRQRKLAAASPSLLRCAAPRGLRTNHDRPCPHHAGLLEPAPCGRARRRRRSADFGNDGFWQYSGAIAG